MTNDCEGQANCDNCQITPCVPQTIDGQNDLGHPFQVQQYTYCSRIIRKRYLKGIVGAIIRALRTGKYTDPLSKVAKRKAANKTLDSSYPITLQNNKTDINCSKNMNKKNTIRLTENDLKRVISESVKKVLNEISIDTMQKVADKASERLHSDAYDSDEEKSRREKQWMNIASTERYKSKSLDKEVSKLFYKYYNEYKDLSKAYEQFKTAMSKAYVTIDRNQGSYNY